MKKLTAHGPSGRVSIEAGEVRGLKFVNYRHPVSSICEEAVTAITQNDDWDRAKEILEQAGYNVKINQLQHSPMFDETDTDSELD